MVSGVRGVRELEDANLELQAHKPLTQEEIQIFKELFDSYVSMNSSRANQVADLR